MVGGFGAGLLVWLAWSPYAAGQTESGDAVSPPSAQPVQIASPLPNAPATPSSPADILLTQATQPPDKTTQPGAAPGSEVPSPEPITVPVPFTVPPPTVPAPFVPGQPPPAERWWLMRGLQGTWLGDFLDGNRLYLSGWTEASYTASTDRVSNFPVAFNDRANKFLLQQAWFRFEHPLLSTGTTEPSLGFHVDVLAGSDYRFTLIRGLFNSQLDNSTGAQNLYGVDPIQFYANAYFPSLFRGTEIRVGRTYNPWGYESLEAVSTPMVSRSYAFFNTPFTLMGVGTYTTFSKEWSTILLLANGNDTFLVPEEEARMFGKITYASANQHDNVQFGWTLGRGRFNAGAPFFPATLGLAQEPAGHNNFNAIDIIYTHLFNPIFTYVNESMYGWQTAVPADPNGGLIRAGVDTPGTAHWASSCHYFRFTLSSRVGATLRVETFDDFDGQRTGFTGLYTAVTGGVQFRLRKGVIIRPELRYDYNGQSRPFEGKHDLFLAATDVIVRW